MPIVSQSATASYFQFPSPFLALPAPKPAAPPADDVRLHDQRLRQLSDVERAELHAACATLLTRAIDFMLGDSHSLDLRAAVDDFHEALTGEPPALHSHTHLKSRLDSFWEESETRMAAAEARIKAEMDAMRRKYHVKPSVIEIEPACRKERQP